MVQGHGRKVILLVVALSAGLVVAGTYARQGLSSEDEVIGQVHSSQAKEAVVVPTETAEISAWLVSQARRTEESHTKAATNPSIKTYLNFFLRHDLYKSSDIPQLAPVGWDAHSANLRKALVHHDWDEAAASVAVLEEMLPDPRLDTYPWNWDDKERFMAGRAQVLLFAGKIEESKEVCLKIKSTLESAVEKDTGVPGMIGMFGRNSIAMQNSQRVLSQIYSIEGDAARSESALQASRDAYWSGCGNCSESEEVWDSPVRQVMIASNDPDLAAIQRLARIRSGEISIVKTELCKSDPEFQRNHAWTEATFALAIYARNAGDHESADLYLQKVASSSSGCYKRDIARAWLGNAEAGPPTG